MYWENWSDFIQMGRHGFYVWTCVLLIVVLLGAELVSLAKTRRQVLRKLQYFNLESSIQTEKIHNQR